MKIDKIIGVCYYNVWIRNIIFSTIFFLVFFFPTLFEKPKSNTDELNSGIIILFFYAHYSLLFIHNHFLFRLILKRKKYFFYLITLLLYLVVFGLLTSSLRILSGRSSDFFNDMILGLIISIISFCVYITNNWIITYITKTKTDLLQKNNELNFLKQQLSPHFLFNALNNLYGISLSSQELMSDKILELSDLLRYQLEAVKKDFVCLEDEINFIQTYFNYSKDKINNIEISVHFTGSYSNIHVPPLLFLPLIENAIKYSIETEKPFIRCNWTFEKDYINFKIENSFLNVDSKNKGTNIGIENLTQRLVLFNIKYELKIEKNIDNIFQIELILWNL